jgi:hypothetical protein
MKRFIFIVIASVYSIGNYGQFSAIKSKRDSVCYQFHKHYSLINYDDLSGYFAEDDYCFEYAGSTDTIAELVRIPKNRKYTSLSGLCIPFIKKFLLPLQLDIPPPVSF